MDRELKDEVVRQATAYMKNVLPPGDWTVGLAGLYAAAQVIEREMHARHQIDAEWLAEVQLVGRRVGAGMVVDVDDEVVTGEDVQ